MLEELVFGFKNNGNAMSHSMNKTVKHRLGAQVS